MPTTPEPPSRARPAREHGTRAILDRYAEGDPAQTLRLDELLSGLGRRAFGMLLFVSALPAFIPIPIGGAIAGPLVVLIGVQLLLGLRRPAPSADRIAISAVRAARRWRASTAAFRRGWRGSNT